MTTSTLPDCMIPDGNNGPCEAYQDRIDDIEISRQEIWKLKSALYRLFKKEWDSDLAYLREEIFSTIEIIVLHCPRCHKEKFVPKDIFDLPETNMIKIICPECDDGDFHEAEYYRKDGTMILNRKDYELPKRKHRDKESP